MDKVPQRNPRSECSKYDMALCQFPAKFSTVLHMHASHDPSLPFERATFSTSFYYKRDLGGTPDRTTDQNPVRSVSEVQVPW